MAQSEGAVTVVLDTNLTPALISEGYAREIVSKVQTMRKDFGLDVIDRIHVTYQATDAVKEAAQAFAPMIMQAVLATTLTDAPAADGAFIRELDLNGEQATLAITKA